jgi:CMP-N,N'-diacetyllegionaminic acid synthase
MKIVSVILARGDSKSIPKKNIIPIKGRPLIYYSIINSKKSKADETWVCSDNDEILKISEDFGAKILKRPSALATDKSKSDESLLFFAENVMFDILVFIQPTSPLLKFNYINDAISKIKNNEYDSVFSANVEHWLPRWSIDLKPVNWDVGKRPMRQDVSPCFVENGAFYVTKRESLLKSGLRYSGKIGCVTMPASESFQLDSYDDLSIIEKLL